MKYKDEGGHVWRDGYEGGARTFLAAMIKVMRIQQARWMSDLSFAVESFTPHLNIKANRRPETLCIPVKRSLLIYVGRKLSTNLILVWCMIFKNGCGAFSWIVITNEIIIDVADLPVVHHTTTQQATMQCCLFFVDTVSSCLFMPLLGDHSNCCMWWVMFVFEFSERWRELIGAFPESIAHLLPLSRIKAHQRPLVLYSNAALWKNVHVQILRQCGPWEKTKMH